jgi:pectate lyase
MNGIRHAKLILISAILALLSAQGLCEESKLMDSKRYVEASRSFADTVLKHGRDLYGEKRTPLFVDGLQVDTLKPAVWKGKGGETWVLSNFASQQPLLRLLDGLTALTGEAKYLQAAEDAARYTLKHLRTPNGFLHWAGHTAWDLGKDRPVGEYNPYVHEMKQHQPYYRLMWRIDAAATRTLMETIWAGHILDWSRLDYNRHASMTKLMKPQWDHDFKEDIEVPFPAKGRNLSFCNVTPPLMHSGLMLSLLDKNKKALTWTRRLVRRWQKACHPKTGLCGGQLSYWWKQNHDHDRARIALGHVHPSINEANIVASYHQKSRYHRLPLTQMQAGESLLNAEGRLAEVGREFIAWASKDLKVYTQHCYEPDKGVFTARMTDGTPIQWQKSRKGYYVPESFAPMKPDGNVLWGYAMAYRLTKDKEHWQMLQRLCVGFGLGNFGRPKDYARALRFDTDHRDWKTIYALLELHAATTDRAVLRLACRVADNILETRAKSGLFPRHERQYARTGDEIPLALLHLAAAIEGRRSEIPQAIVDSRFFHCVYHGKLEAHRKKRADRRTYDGLVFYGSD